MFLLAKRMACEKSMQFLDSHLSNPLCQIYMPGDLVTVDVDEGDIEQGVDPGLSVGHT